MKSRLLIRHLIISIFWLTSIAAPIANAESFGGFGIVVAQIYDDEAPGNRGGIVILNVPQDSEAHEAGLRSGDIITEIDGEKTSGREFGDVVLNSLRGKVGSASVFTIKRVSENTTFDVRAERVRITYDK